MLNMVLQLKFKLVCIYSNSNNFYREVSLFKKNKLKNLKFNKYHFIKIYFNK